MTESESDATEPPRDQSFTIGAVTETDTAGAIVVISRLYLSSEYLWTAEHLANLAAAIEDEHPPGTADFSIHVRSYVLASIGATVSFLESFINEILEDCGKTPPAFIADLDPAKRRALASWWAANRKKWPGIPDKLSRVEEEITGTKLNKGAQPWQDVDLVLELRNHLHHYSPVDLSVNTRHALGERLKRKRFPENKMMTCSNNPWFPDKALGAGCARWALKTARDFADQFVEKLGVSAHYREVQYVSPEVPGASNT